MIGEEAFDVDAYAEGVVWCVRADMQEKETRKE